LSAVVAEAIGKLVGRGIVSFFLLAEASQVKGAKTPFNLAEVDHNNNDISSVYDPDPGPQSSKLSESEFICGRATNRTTWY
jgi:hypothetical protein